jgi:hypothetical protein
MPHPTSFGIINGMSIKGVYALFGAIIGAFAIYLWGFTSLINARATTIILPSASAATQATAQLSTPPSLTPTIDLPPILDRACSCESTGDPTKGPRQFNTDGSILWGNDPNTGKPIKRDVGACQINTIAWAKLIASSNLDAVNSLHDNEAFALMIYNAHGMQPWSPSKSCWN